MPSVSIPATTPVAVDTVAELRDVSGRTGEAMIVAGYATAGDGGGGAWTWNAAADDDDDDGLTVKPDDIDEGDPGRWERSYSGSIDVRWFGCLPGLGGLLPRTTQLQAALDAAAGAQLYIPPGVYDIDNSTHASSNTRVTGAGIGATKLRGSAGSYAGALVSGTLLGATLGAVGKSHIVVEDLTIDNATNGTIANGIALVPTAVFTGTPCTDCTVQNCEVLSSLSHAYGIWSMRGKQIRIVNNRVHGGVTDFSVFEDHEGISLFGGEDVLIAGNIVTGCGNDGINVAASVDFPDASNTNIEISNNVVSGCRDGINLGTAWDAVNGAQNLVNVLVCDNVINNCGENGIYAWTPNAGASFLNVQIVDNTVNGGPVGITLQGFAATTSHRNVVIRGNGLRGQTTEVAALVVNLFNGADVIDNRVTGSAGEGIRIDRSDDVTVQGNRISDTVLNGLRVSACDNCVANDNRFAGCAPNTFGAYFTDSVMNVAKGNTFQSASPFAHIYMDGTSGIVADNVSIVGIATPFVNACTTANFGVTTAMTASATTFDVTNALAKSGSRFVVTQLAGTPIAFKVGFITGGFRITTASAAVGNETFNWEIR